MLLRGLTSAIASLVLTVTSAQAQLSDMGDPDDFSADVAKGEPVAQNATPDPWEGFNRKMFAFNDTFDRALIVPTAKAYRAVTHKKQRKGIRNFFANLQAPVTLFNDLMQGEFGRAGDTLGRFMINSTVGFGGMGDPAERLGLAPHSEDFGQTLAVWGLDSGPFLVLPFFGPSTLRDGFGAGVDAAATHQPGSAQVPHKHSA